MSNRIVFLSIIICLASCCVAQVKDNVPASTKTFSYTNPITRDTAIAMRDHCIIKVGDKWYCVGSSLPVWTAQIQACDC